MFRKNLFCFVFTLSTLPVLSQNLAQKPNILFIVADDWSKHAGIYGDRVIRTPNIDKLGKDGLIFDQAFCSAASCSPSRASILTGKYPHQMAEGGNLWGSLPVRIPNFVSLIQESGGFVGSERKGWGPGNFKIGGYLENPAGKNFKDFDEFLGEKPKDKPFFYWFGSIDPHREYVKGTGEQAGLDPQRVQVPGFLPDTDVVRKDILDYYFEVERFDSNVGKLIAMLASKGELENTLVIITSDNGMPFPRAKATCYDSGTNVPLIIYWKGKIKPARSSELVSLIDLAPTILDVMGIKKPADLPSKSLINLLNGRSLPSRSAVFVERERHANVRKGDLGYPIRGIRTKEFLYLRNFEPNRFPAGDPQKWVAVGPYGDIDDSPTKKLILSDTLKYSFFVDRTLKKRGSEELYDLKNDPNQLHNLASEKQFEKQKNKLKIDLEAWMKRTGDPRFTNPTTNLWDRYPYY
jgi:N-sulfoglucosamine sulfohydrolase